MADHHHRGSEPYWTADGSEIIFRDESRNFLAIPVDLGETVRANIPEALFQGHVMPEIRRNFFQVTPDGERFLLLAPSTARSALMTTAVLNWTAGLEQ